MSSSCKYGVTAMGNAIVDILAPVSDDVITKADMQRGGMTLIDAARAADLYALMSNATEMSGGSAGNTMAAYASFGGKGAYIGKVADDQFGQVFRRDTQNIGVHFDTAPLLNADPTAQCLIFVTPDAQRTMNTFLGACNKITSADVDESLIADSEITYLEGYLFDLPEAKKAFYKAAEYVKKHGRKLSLTLSDSFCVNRYRAEFLEFVTSSVDILFANESEICALFEVNNVEDAVEKVRPLCDISAITLSEKGSIVVAGAETIKVAPVMPPQLVDTTGAGDAYAAGFMFGLTSGESLAQCGHLGSIAASEVISHMGPRPLVALKDLISKKAA